jgi:hypothetical protein
MQPLSAPTARANQGRPTYLLFIFMNGLEGCGTVFCGLGRAKSHAFLTLRFGLSPDVPAWAAVLVSGLRVHEATVHQFGPVPAPIRSRARRSGRRRPGERAARGTGEGVPRAADDVLQPRMAHFSMRGLVHESVPGAVRSATREQAAAPNPAGPARRRAEPPRPAPAEARSASPGFEPSSAVAAGAVRAGRPPEPGQSRGGAGAPPASPSGWLPQPTREGRGARRRRSPRLPGAPGRPTPSGAGVRSPRPAHRVRLPRSSTSRARPVRGPVPP